MLRRRWRTLSGFCLLVVLASLPARVALAQQETVDQGAIDEARRLFTRGSALFVAKHYAEALDSLRASYNLVASPNSGLVIARCLRELKRPVEALAMFAAVEGDARRRVAAGEAKYGRTASSAATEGADMRTMLGSLRIRIAQPTPETTLTVDETQRPIPPDGLATVWHAPGEARVSVRRPDSPDQTQAATVPAGGEVQMEFGAPSVPKPEPPATVPPAAPHLAGPPPLPTLAPTEPAAPSSWAKPAAWVAGITSVAGFGVFAGFGLASLSEYQDLKNQCGTHCDSSNQSERSAADTGKRNQLIANVGVIAGSVGAAATVTFVIVALASPRERATAYTPRLHIGPASAALKMAW